MRFDEENSVYLIGRVLGKLNPDCIAASDDIERYRSLHLEETDPTGYGNEDEIVRKELIDRYLK